VGDRRACLIEDDQSVWCWGGNYGSVYSSNASLLLGDTHRMFPAPVKIPGMKGRQVSVAYNNQCVLHDDGTVGCWGESQPGALGTWPGQEYATVDPVPNLSGVVEISVGDGQCVCARLQSGEVDCWGSEDHGCIGTAGTVQGTATPTKVPLPAPAVQIRAGDGYFLPSCARLVTGTVACWSYYLPPQEIPGITQAEDIAIGWLFMAARTKNGLLWSAEMPPAADAGTVDGGAAPYTWLPAASYPGFGTITQMSGTSEFCAVEAGGTVLCASSHGGWGNPGPPSQVPMPAGKTPVEVGTGWGNNYGASIACVRTAGASIKDNVYCWGDDYDGALGIGGPEYKTTKQDIPSFSTHTVTALTAGAASLGVVLDDGSAWFWGHSGAYQNSYQPQTTPAVLLNLAKNNATLQSGDFAGLGYAVKTATATISVFHDGTADSPQGRLLSYASPSYVDVRAGYIDFGLLSSGTVVAYSDDPTANRCGLFGNGGTGNVSGPQAVPGVTAAKIAYGDQNDNGCSSTACVVTAAGTVQCWGNNGSGQAGVAGGNPVYTPSTVSIPGAKAITSLAVGSDFACATDGPSGTGKVYCWGSNSFGQLGLDFTYDYTSAVGAPISMASTQPVVGVTAYGQFACAWLADKTVWCWGNNDRGQLGNGTFDAQPQPVQVTGISDALSVTAGADFACALRTGGVVSCWGSSYWGQGGLGLHGDDYPTPTAVVGLP
jgi:alpha-tubulin suppressor-like RCC1 family protein